MATEITQVSPVTTEGGTGGSGGIVDRSISQNLTIKDGELTGTSGVSDALAIVAAHPELAFLILALVGATIYFVRKGIK